MVGHLQIYYKNKSERLKSSAYKLTHLNKYYILKKYHLVEDYNLNYLISDDIVTFFLSINEGNLVTMEDLYKISGILNAKIKDMVLVNQEYRFSFEMEK